MEQKQESSLHYHFFITGFGAFGSHITNPTSKFIALIRANKSEFENKHFTITDCRVLDVAIEYCEEYYSQILKMINDHKEKNPNHQIIIIHFGLNSGLKCFNLELHGYNCADFRIPDNKNNQPKNKQISKKFPLEHYFRTMLPIIEVSKCLNYEGFKVELSDNPGRFICNYIYYLSMINGYKHDFRSLFVHVPEFCDLKEEIQVNFVKKLFQTIVKCTYEQDKTQL